MWIIRPKKQMNAVSLQSIVIEFIRNAYNKPHIFMKWEV